jgi:TRAP-type C4-dicarboxylate transport system permease small subunit
MTIPIWIPYALMTPGLGLTAVVSLFIAWRRATSGDPLE